MRRASKRCATPGCNYPATTSGYCDEVCNAKKERARRRTTPTKAARTWSVAEHRRAAVRAHVEQYGWHCVGDDKHPAHDTRDLVADDPIPIAKGGDPMQPLNVMCRAANSSKGAR